MVALLLTDKMARQRFRNLQRSTSHNAQVSLQSCTTASSTDTKTVSVFRAQQIITLKAQSLKLQTSVETTRRELVVKLSTITRLAPVRHLITRY